MRNRVLDICLYLGIVFALVGLLILVTNNVLAGLVVVICGIAFVVLSLGFGHVKIKGGPIEMQADR